MKLRNIIIILVVAGLAALIAYRFVTSGNEEKVPSIEEIQRTEGIPVDVFAAKVGPFEHWKKLIGSLEGIKQAPIYSNMPARIRQVFAKQGQHVGVGSTIITLDPLSVQQSYSALEGARLNYENLKRDFERMKPLHEAGAISDSQFDQMKMAVSAAEASLTDVSSAITLRSPIAGTLTDLRVRPGDKINPGDTLAVVADLREANLRLNVSQTDLEEIKVGQVALLLDRNGNEMSQGQVQRVSLSANPETRLFLVEITIDGNGSLLPGTLQNVKIRTINLENVLMIPLSAIMTSGQETFAFVVDQEGKCVKRPIKIQYSNSKWAVIEDGIVAGEQVVVWGMNLLNGGEKVKIHKVVEDL